MKNTARGLSNKYPSQALMMPRSDSDCSGKDYEDIAAIRRPCRPEEDLMAVETR